jgi:hypothetical protein
MISRTALLATLLLLITACTPAAGGSPPASAASSGLAAADAKLYSGNYDGAEAAYLKLAAGGDATAMAHHALLLDYENRFPEAVAQARAALQVKPSSTVQASLARALDWSEDLPGALAAGARAVSASGRDPLAHAFYGEALADAAHFPEARAQLKQAEKLARDPYTTSEVEREWANYYRGLGDPLEEVNHLELSLRAQPGFPERALEMARFRYADQEQAAARKLLDGIRTGHSGDYGVNVAAADTAFIQGDLDTAEPFYKAALKLQPTGATASLGEAELLVSGQRDFPGAHDLLLAALRAHPDSAALYDYLYYLDRLILKTDPAAELNPIKPSPPAQRADAAKQALDKVNAFRSGLGLPAVAGSAALDDAALAHAYFWFFNYGQPAVADVKIHTEDPTLPGAFAGDPLARGQHFGYAGPRVAEVISHVYVAGAAVDRWVDAVFHRLPLSDPETVSAGFGEAEAGALSIQVLDLGQGAGGQHDPVAYPGPDQTGVPFAFLGDEIPDPAPGAHYPTGYPITLQVGGSSTLKVTTASLVGPDGHGLNGYELDSTNSDLKDNQWGVLPRDPLLPGSRYTVKVEGTVDGRPFSKTWSFTVAPLPS